MRKKLDNLGTAGLIAHRDGLLASGNRDIGAVAEANGAMDTISQGLDEVSGDNGGRSSISDKILAAMLLLESAYDQALCTDKVELSGEAAVSIGHGDFEYLLGKIASFDEADHS